jgi:hypothetical protein
MSDFVIGLAFGGVVVLGAVALARYMRAAADERLREKRYADEWVRRHRESRQP